MEAVSVAALLMPWLKPRRAKTQAVSERLVSSTKSKYKLQRRYVYLVEERKPQFSFQLFAELH